MKAEVTAIATARSPRKDLKVEGRVLTVRGLDAIDGAPVLDVKPWMDEVAPIGATRQPAWASELMQDYFKD